MKAISDKVKMLLPFVLLHRSGVTKEVYYTIFDMASQGNSFSDIEKFLLWRYQEKHSMALLNYVGVQQAGTVQIPPCLYMESCQ